MGRILALFCAAALLLCGCTPTVSTPGTLPPESVPPTETPAAFQYDKYSIDGYTATYIQPDAHLYRLVFDAADRFAPTAPITGTTPTEEEAAAVAAAVFARFEFSYIQAITLSPDGRAFLLHYRPGFTEETALAAKTAFRDKVEFLLEEVVSPQNTPRENVIALYQYFSACTYDETAADVGCYGIMVHGTGICTGYAYALRYLLDQLGIPSHLAFSTDESHVWNLVELEGAFYHLDATWESQSRSEKPSMDFFAMTDAQRRQDFEGWYGGGNSAYPRYTLPESAVEAPVGSFAAKSAVT